MTEDRFKKIELRLAALEDELAIIRLVASYGPMVDSGLTRLAPELFADDGVYDVEVGSMSGRDAFETMLGSAEHQGLVRQGIAHVMGLPFVRIDGDRATAVNPTFLFQREGEGYRIFRVAQNVWRLARIDGAWKIEHRTNRTLGDNGAARALLESAFA